MSAGPNDLTTVADVQQWLGITSPAQDAALLQRLVSAASAMIQSYIGYNVALTTYTETRSGSGKNSLFLKNRPVTAISSLSVAGIAQTPSLAYGQPGYAFDVESVFLTGSAFGCGFQNVTITYTAGYATTPLDIAQACIELVALRYKLRDKTGFVSEGALGQTTSYSQKDMPASVITALKPYTRVI